MILEDQIKLLQKEKKQLKEMLGVVIGEWRLLGGLLTPEEIELMNKADRLLERLSDV